MTVLQTLTIAEVKAKAREYYAAGKLTAQHPDPEKRECVNKGADGHRCAVAAAFNDALLEAYPEGAINDQRAGELVRLDDASAIWRIQDAHDNWASASKCGTERAGLFEQEFLELINED